MEKGNGFRIDSAIWCLSFCFLLIQIGCQTGFGKGKDHQVDVLIYSASPAGISAAIHASRQGCSVLITEKSTSIPVEGFVFAHSRFPAIRTGFFREISDSVQKLVKRKFGEKAPDSLFLARTYRKTLLKILKKCSVEVQYGYHPDSAREIQFTNRKQIGFLVFSNSEKLEKKRTYSARFFIDASESGELMTRFPCRFRRKNVLNPDWDLKLGNLENEVHSGAKRKENSPSGYQLEGRHWLNMKELRAGNQTETSGFSTSSVGVGIFSENEDGVFSIPFGIMVPTAPVPILCPGPISSSYLVSTLMSHPVNQMVLGQAAGVAASVCLKKKIFPIQLPVDSLQSYLIRCGFELIFLKDVIPVLDSDFEVFQRLALMNCFPENAVGFLKEWQEPDFVWLSERTGFSILELGEITRGKTRREGLREIWKVWENANKGQP